MVGSFTNCLFHILHRKLQGLTEQYCQINFNKIGTFGLQKITTVRVYGCPRASGVWILRRT
jgi:hypothetical protein